MNAYLKVLFLSLILWLPKTLLADEEPPSVNPTMTVTGDDYDAEETTEYAGNAPMYAVFRANPENLGDYTPLYEWRFTKDNEAEPFLIRYDENTEYNFTQSGGYKIELRVTFVNGADTLDDYEMDEPFSVTINESRLEVPNAFTPNGDGINDVLKVKDGYQSIVSFKAMVFSRWGKKLYEWTDISQGWDGRSGGNNCPDGAYYLHIDAKGADGRNYKVRKTINLLRGYQENSGTID